MFVRAFARAIRPGWRLRSMTPVAIPYLRARDRPMYMQNAWVVWAPRTTRTGAAVVRSAIHTAVASTRRWTACEGTQSRRLGRRRRCTYTLGRGSVHSVGAGSVVASKILADGKGESCQRNMKRTGVKYDAIYKDDRDGPRGPLPLVIHGVLSPERQCRLRMTLRWPSGHGAVRCGHFVNEDL